MGDGVTTRCRGDICVVRCSAGGGRGVAAELRAEPRRCHESGVRDVVLDMDLGLTLSDEDLAAAAAAAAEFHGRGGELVVAAEEARFREALTVPGAAHDVPPLSPALEIVRSGVSASSCARLRWHHGFTFAATPGELSRARRRVTTLAEVGGLVEPRLFEFAVAVAEALTNAVVHGSPRGRADQVRVRFFSFEEEVAVEVADSGPGMTASPIAVPGASETGGRGIHSMRALCDVVQFANTPRGTHVVLVKSLR